MIERKDSLDTAAAAAASRPAARVLPPVLSRLLTGTFWLALRVPLQAVFSLWTTRLVLESVHVGAEQWGAYRFAWGFGFFQFLFEFGASSALQRQISEAWTRGDHDGVDRSIACGMTFYTVVAVLQVAALLGVAYWALPMTAFDGKAYELIAETALAAGSDSSVLWLFGSGLERAPGRPALRFHAASRDFQHHRAVHRSCGRPQVRIRLLRGGGRPDSDPGRNRVHPAPLGDGPRAGLPACISAVRGWLTTSRCSTSASISR